jgi:DNA helicase-2/ATP-dependent DNA helicase PcrA
VKHLVDREGLKASDVLILLRTDHNGIFSKPIKEALDTLDVAYTDPDAVENLLSETPNRGFLEHLRLLVNREDSLAWASLLRLKNGIGAAFTSYVYEKALGKTAPFGRMLLQLHGENFPGAPITSARKAKDLIDKTLAWLEAHALPEEVPEQGWGRWIAATGSTEMGSPTEELKRLLQEVDAVTEAAETLGRYLSQIQPLGEDIARAKSEGVRIMSMMASKGLTVRATIVVGAEDGLVPRPGADLGEERRILYVAMTRPKEFLFLTWARRRYGPQARAGQATLTRRQSSHFLNNGPLASQDGETFIGSRCA